MQTPCLIPIKNQKGFLLIGIVFIMLLMAVTVFSINYYSVTQLKIADNLKYSVQATYDLNAALEASLWKLSGNPFWRIEKPGKDFCFQNDYSLDFNCENPDFNLTILDSKVLRYEDAISVEIKRKPSDQALERSFRYYSSKFPEEFRENYLNELLAPEKIFMKDSGTILIADSMKHQLYELDPDNLSFTKIAGKKDFGYKDGFINSAKFYSPKSIISDSGSGYAEKIYIADTGNHAIRKISLSFWVDSLIGSGEGNTGDGNLYWYAKLSSPNDIHYYVAGSDSGLYVADTDNHRVRKVSFTTDRITAFASNQDITSEEDYSGGYSGDGVDDGAETAELNTPRGICLDKDGNLLIADTENNRIRKVEKQVDDTFKIFTIAGVGPAGYSGDGGLAISAMLNKPEDIFVDSNGYIFIADTQNHVIRVIDENGVISTFAGTDEGDLSDVPAVTAQFDNPVGIAIPSHFGRKRIYVSDRKNKTIKILSLKVVREL